MASTFLSSEITIHNHECHTDDLSRYYVTNPSWDIPGSMIYSTVASHVWCSMEVDKLLPADFDEDKRRTDVYDLV